MNFSALITAELRGKEGFWRKSADGSYDMHNFSPSCFYPYPEPQENNIGVEFTTKLQQLEDSIEREEKGFYYYIKRTTKCCLCKKILGSKVYEYKSFEWPQSYMHYLVEHNVHPSAEFKTFVESE